MFISGKFLKEDINWFNKTDKSSRVIGWISGGVASAVACILASREYENIHYAFTDTGIEHPDSFRFISQIQNILGKEVHIYKSEKFNTPEDIFFKYNALGYAKGAPCSDILKAQVRVQQVENINSDYAQIFGFDFNPKEIGRAVRRAENHPELNPKFPLIEHEMDRTELTRFLLKLNITPPPTI